MNSLIWRADGTGKRATTTGDRTAVNQTSANRTAGNRTAVDRTAGGPAALSVPNSLRALIGAASAGAAVALSLGLYGRFHTPTGLAVDPIRPEHMLAFKSILTSIGAGLALFQLASAWWLYGRRPFALPAPRWVGPAHRWSGTVAFVATLPAGYHCLWSLGLQTPTTRVALHSLLGCAFYGAFATKLLAVRSNRMPGWALPLVGATVVTLMVALWFTSALWFFTRSV